MSDRDVTVVPDDYTAKLMAEVARLEAKSAGLLKELEAEHALAEMLGHWLDDAKAENAKLREECDEWHDEQVQAFSNWKDAYERTIELSTENAKLRKLVRGLHYCSDELTSAECDKCPANDPTDEHLGPTCLKMMEELGIEVDE